MAWAGCKVLAAGMRAVGYAADSDERALRNADAEISA
jgi:hypothetical protein